jgi:8-amino-7-oxononanoate synthase
VETVTNNIQDALQQMLDKRKGESLYRSLQVQHGLIDFCSNDYLSFARSVPIARQARKYLSADTYTSGATGSRSISGNTVLAEELEKFIANFHEAEAGLLFNSGYDANVGLFSSVAKKEDTLICDELIHASIIDGCRLSYANRFRFAHNDTEDLEKKLKNTGKGNVFVAVESVYSMDGDMAPLNDIVALCKRYEANLIVDEAHATGVFGRQGRGFVHELGLQADVFARVHTFGKAIGSHGAIITGSKTLITYHQSCI